VTTGAVEGVGVGVVVEGVDAVGAAPDPIAPKSADAIVYDPGMYTIRTVCGVPELRV
jgi:hypothetical protein